MDRQHQGVGGETKRYMDRHQDVGGETKRHMDRQHQGVGGETKRHVDRQHQGGGETKRHMDRQHQGVDGEMKCEDPVRRAKSSHQWRSIRADLLMADGPSDDDIDCNRYIYTTIIITFTYSIHLLLLSKFSMASIHSSNLVICIIVKLKF